MANVCKHFPHSLPNADSKVHKDECVLCFDDLTDKGGLDVCLTCFRGGCTGALNHSYQHRQRSGHSVVLNIKRILKEKQKQSEITKVEIGGEGGALLEGMKGTYEDFYTVHCYECDVDLDTSLPPIQQVMDAVIAAQSESSKSDVAAWKQEIGPCEHVFLLHQDPNAHKLGARGMSHCGMCDLPNNLWLCLTCGHLGCGRQQMEIGTQINLGGNGHALAHHEATGHPIAVKTGTISPNGTADTWCYSCYFGSGNDVTDPKLAEHLKHFGIDLATQSKTEKTIAEMTLEQNLKLSFFSSKENGVVMKPLYGPGLTGLINIGNSCYLSSVLQCVCNIPDFQQRYYPGHEHEEICERHPAECYQCQMGKLLDGMMSGRYSKKKEISSKLSEGKESEEKPNVEEEEEQRGIAPRMLKRIVCKGHADFEGMQQQDAYEFFQHLIKTIQQNERANGKEKDPSRVFLAKFEQKNQCQECKHIRYSSFDQTEIKLSIPLDCAQPPLQPVEGEPKEQEQEREGKSLVKFIDCLNSFKEPELIRGFHCPVCKKTTSILKTVGVLRYPDVFMANVSRFVLDGWVRAARKLHVNVDVDDIVDFSVIAASQHQPDELLFPEENASPQAAAVNQEDLQQLISMGFDPDLCQYALEDAHNSGVEQATMWLFDNASNPDVLEKIAAKKSQPKSGGANVDAVPSETIELICSMGFSVAQARYALKETSNDAERAVDWLFSHPDFNVEEGSSEANEKGEAESVMREEGPVLYELYGAVQHRGTSTASGHYVAYIKIENQWVQFNDSKVTESLSPPIGQGYMYFFRRLKL